MPALAEQLTRKASVSKTQKIHVFIFKCNWQPLTPQMAFLEERKTLLSLHLILQERRSQLMAQLFLKSHAF